MHWWNPQVALMMSLPGLHMCVRTDVTHPPARRPPPACTTPTCPQTFMYTQTSASATRDEHAGPIPTRAGRQTHWQIRRGPRGGCFFLTSSSPRKRLESEKTVANTSQPFIPWSCHQFVHFLSSDASASAQISVERRTKSTPQRCGHNTHTHTHPPGPASDEDSGSRGSPFSPRESRDPLQEAHHLPLPGHHPCRRRSPLGGRFSKAQRHLEGCCQRAYS